MTDYITADARKLLQRLTARGALLIYNTETEQFTFAAQGRDEILHGQKHRAAKEVLHLCAVKTVVKLHPQIRFELSEEGLRILMRKGYVPAIIAAKNRPQEPRRPNASDGIPVISTLISQRQR